MGGGSDAPDPAKTGFEALPRELREKGLQAGDLAFKDFQAGPQEFFPGQTFAGLDPLQLAGMQAQQNFAESILPGQLNSINASFGNALSGFDPSNPAIQAGLGVIENRANQNFLENVLPGLRRGATATGGEYGTRGELAAGVAADRLSQSIGDSQAQFLANQLGSARQLQGAALSLAPQQAQLGLMPGQIQQQLGGVFQNLAGQQIAEDMARFNFEQQAGDMNLDQYLSRLGGITGLGGASSIGAEQQGTSTSPLAGALGGGMLGAQLGSMIPGFGGGVAGGLTALGPAGLALGAGGAILGGLLS